MTQVIWADQRRLDLQVLTEDYRGGMVVGAIITDEGNYTVTVGRNGTGVEIRAEEKIPETDPDGVANTVDMVTSTKTTVAGITLDESGTAALLSLLSRANDIRRAINDQRHRLSTDSPPGRRGS
jgi:hypothetical protein